MDASIGGYEEIIRRLDLLMTGQARLEAGHNELKAGHNELRAGLESLKTEMRSEFKEVREAARENHRLLFETIEALNIASLRNRADVTELQRKFG
jgi:predicted RNase H-like nuclease (RuvC/YqgF family)